MVFQLVYASAATDACTREELVTLLTQARARNEACRITGMLLYREGRFLQLLEGDEQAVRRLYAAIRLDLRHRDVTMLCEGRRLLRQFPRWSMSFRDLDEDPLTEAGFTALFDDALDQVQWAVDELVTRLRPSGPPDRPRVHLSRMLGLVDS